MEGQNEAGVKQKWIWAGDGGIDQDWARVEILLKVM